MLVTDPARALGTSFAHLPATSFPFYGLSGTSQHSTSPLTGTRAMATQSLRMTENDIEKFPPSPESFLASFTRIQSACLRLARLHTIMAWVTFPAPAIYTVVLYHSSANFLPRVERVFGCMRLCLAMFLCVMSYRAAGLAWDDLIDRDFDAQVRRSMTRPLPSGDISVDGALLYIIFQIGVTIVLLQTSTTPEVFLTFLVSGALFGIYPYLKRWTNYTQIFGAILISMGVLQGWLACATVYNPIPGYTPGWNHALAIIHRDWAKLLPIFLMELFYELAHELIYGCQDTAEDVLIGLHSLSILCGYESSRSLGTVFIVGFTGLLAYCAQICQVMWWPIALIPCIWLVRSTYYLDLSVPAICGKWANSAIKIKFLITSILTVSFLLREFVFKSSSSS